MSRKRKRKEWKDGDTGESGRKTTLSDRVFIGRAKAEQRVEIPVDAQGQRNLLSPVAYPYLCWDPASSENA